MRSSPRSGHHGRLPGTVPNEMVRASAGILPKNSWRASKPPADAPIPTTGKRSLGRLRRRSRSVAQDASSPCPVCRGKSLGRPVSLRAVPTRAVWLARPPFRTPFASRTALPLGSHVDALHLESQASHRVYQRNLVCKQPHKLPRLYSAAHTLRRVVARGNGERRPRYRTELRFSRVVAHQKGAADSARQKPAFPGIWSRRTMRKLIVAAQILQKWKKPHAVCFVRGARWAGGSTERSDRRETVCVSEGCRTIQLALLGIKAARPA